MGFLERREKILVFFVFFAFLLGIFLGNKYPVRSSGAESLKAVFSRLNLFKAKVAPDISVLEGTGAATEPEEAEKTDGTEKSDEAAETGEKNRTEESKETKKIGGTGGPELILGDFQDVIDDIQERTDIIGQKAAVLTGEPAEKENVEEKREDEEKEEGDEKPDETKEEKEKKDAKESGKTEKKDDLPPADVKQASQSSASGGASVRYCEKSADTGALLDKVIINEIAWAGTDNSSADEWIELKNISQDEIDISGWQIIDKESQIKIIFPGNFVIPAGNFILLERTDDSSVGHVLADLVYSGALGNNGEALYLFNSECQLEDEVLAEPDWPAGSTQEKRTMERGGDFSWRTHSGQGYSGIMGTPGAENSEPLPAVGVAADITPPSVLFGLEPVQTSLAFVISLRMTDFVTPGAADGVGFPSVDTASPSGLDGFVFRWKIESGGWQEDEFQKIDGSPLAYSKEKPFEGAYGESYYFQVNVRDIAGNETGWVPEPPAVTRVDIPKKVLINEIQIDGKAGPGGADDDWAELYNPGDVAISLDGWSIQEHSSAEPCSVSHGFSKKNFPGSAIVEARQFFLVADTQADEFLKGLADMTIGWSLTEGNTVYLVKNQDVIVNGDDADVVDKVGFGENACFVEGGPAPNPLEGGSIERKGLGLDTDNNGSDFASSASPTPKTF